MNAVIKHHQSLRQTVLDDARWGTGEAHLEPHEVPQWIEEAGDQDIAAELGDAISDLEDKPREKFCALLEQLCREGERMPMQQGIDLLAGLRAVLTDHAIREAQKFVDKEIGEYDPTPWCSGCGSRTKAGCDCGPIASNE
jgi:hypothetical protein